MLNDSEVFDMVSGIAVHWYWDRVDPNKLTRTHELFPDKFILNTEACEGRSNKKWN